MDHLCIGREAIKFAGGAVIQAGTDNQQQVAFIHGLIGRPGAVHAQHAQVVWVVFAGVANAFERYHRRQSGGFSKRAKAVFSVCQTDATSAIEYGFAGRPKHRECVGQIWKAGLLGFGMEVGGIADVSQQQVLGNINPHRSRSSTLSQFHGFFHDSGQRVGIVNEVTVFNDAQRHAQYVGFLEGVGADQAGGHLAGDDQQRNGIPVGVGYAGDQVGGARAGGSNAYAELAACTGVAVGGKGAGLFVAAKHMLHADIVHQRIV